MCQEIWQQCLEKLICELKYLKITLYLPLVIEVCALNLLMWWVESSFAIHPDCKDHTGGMLCFGKGAVTNFSQKQKINRRRSTQSELLDMDDDDPQMLQTNYFRKSQGYNITENIVFKNNISAVFLTTHGKKFRRRWTKYIDVHFCFVTNKIKSDELTIKYCPASKIWEDDNTNLSKDNSLRNSDPLSWMLTSIYMILNCTGIDSPIAVPDHRSVLGI